MIPDLTHHPHFAFIPVTGKVKRKMVLRLFLVHPVLTQDNDLRGQLRRWGAVLIDQNKQHGRMTLPEAVSVYEANSQDKQIETAIEVLYHKSPEAICWCNKCLLVISIQSISTDLRKSYPTVAKSVIQATEGKLREAMLEWRRGEGVVYEGQRYRCKFFKCRTLFYPAMSRAFPYCRPEHRNAQKKKWGWFYIQLPSGNLSKRFKKSCRTCNKTFWGTDKALRCRSCLDAPKKRKRAKRRKTKKRAKGIVKGKRRKRCLRCNALFMPKSSRQKYCPKCSKHGK